VFGHLLFDALQECQHDRVGVFQHRALLDVGVEVRRNFDVATSSANRSP
jgi:hypothetical protein